jgi:DNA-binding NtrC family response regulator
MMRIILEDADYQVLEADSIDSALQAIANNDIYGAVLDVHFGEERDGIWLLKEIQKMKNGIKVIVVSGSEGQAKDAWRLRANENGAISTFDKLKYTEDQILQVFSGI